VNILQPAEPATIDMNRPLAHGSLSKSHEVIDEVFYAAEELEEKLRSLMLETERVSQLYKTSCGFPDRHVQRIERVEKNIEEYKKYLDDVGAYRRRTTIPSTFLDTQC
jgi:hypothetical protein